MHYIINIINIINVLLLIFNSGLFEKPKCFKREEKSSIEEKRGDKEDYRKVIKFILENFNQMRVSDGLPDGKLWQQNAFHSQNYWLF